VANAGATCTLGFPVLLDSPDLFLFAAGGTAFGVRGPAADTPAGDRFNPSRVGLDHVALGCTDEGELKRVADALREAGVENTASSWMRHLGNATSLSKTQTGLPGSSTAPEGGPKGSAA
jgi:hypothetical protein